MGQVNKYIRGVGPEHPGGESPCFQPPQWVGSFHFEPQVGGGLFYFKPWILSILQTSEGNFRILTNAASVKY